MYVGQEVTSGSPGCLLAVPRDQKMEAGRDSAMEGLFSFFSLFSSLPPPPPPSPKKSWISHDLGKWLGSRVWLQSILWPFPARGCEAPGDMSPLAPRPWPGRAHPSSPAGGRVWERPRWRGRHLLPSLCVLRGGRAGGGPGVDLCPRADPEHHRLCPGDEAAVRVGLCPRPWLFGGGVPLCSPPGKVVGGWSVLRGEGSRPGWGGGRDKQ